MGSLRSTLVILLISVILGLAGWRLFAPPSENPETTELLRTKKQAEAQRDSLFEVIAGGLEARDTVLIVLKQQDSTTAAALRRAHARQAHSDSLAADTLELKQQRDTALNEWAKVAAAGVRKDTLLAQDSRRLTAAILYHVKAEGRIDSLTTRLQHERGNWTRFLPKAQCTIGPSTFDAKIRGTCGFGYTIHLRSTHS